MNNLERISISCSLLVTATLVWFYASKGQIAWLLVIMLAGLLQLFWKIKKDSGTGTSGLLFAIMAAVYGIFLAMPYLLAMSLVILSIAIWDLDDFTIRMRMADEKRDKTRLAQQHLLKMLCISLLSFFLGCILLIVKIKLGFFITLALSCMVIVGLVLIIKTIRRAADHES